MTRSAPPPRRLDDFNVYIAGKITVIADATSPRWRAIEGP
jgi:hypothetical protein